MAKPQNSVEVMEAKLIDIAANASEALEERKELLEAAQNLVLALESPKDVIERVCYQHLETTTIKIGVELGIFRFLVDEAEPRSDEDIAKATNSDPVLIGRIMRCLAAYGAVKEVGKNGYAPTTVSRTFADERNAAALELCFDFHGPSWVKLPQHLKDLQYRNPAGLDINNTALAKGWNASGKSLFEIVFLGPHVEAFGSYMASFTMGHKAWTDIYPVQTRMIEGFEKDEEAVMFVDVGGGFGHQAKALKDAFPGLPGRLIVQDPAQIKGEDIPGIEFQVHDFNHEQPVKGARVYYLRFVVHDWGFDDNVRILTHLCKAMKPGYSRLIINELIISERKPSRFATIEDMNMMSLGGMERTEKQYRELLEAAGLKVEMIYYPGDTVSESVIEAVVP